LVSQVLMGNSAFTITLPLFLCVIIVPFFPQQERIELNRLFEKYVPCLIDMITEGIVDGKQEERLKTIVPQTDLNMVRNRK